MQSDIRRSARCKYEMALLLSEDLRMRYKDNKPQAATMPAETSLAVGRG